MAEDHDASQSNGFGAPRSPARSEIINSLSLGTPRTRPTKVPSASGGSFIVWPMTKDIREVNDVVHTDIKIPPAVQRILDTPPVQRLNNLTQLGVSMHFLFSLLITIESI